MDHPREENRRIEESGPVLASELVEQVLELVLEMAGWESALVLESPELVKVWGLVVELRAMALRSGVSG